MKAKVKTWLKNVENGNIKGMTENVLGNIRYWERINTHTLRDYLDISHQSLTAVLSNLHDEGLINVVGQDEIGNSHYSIYVFVSDDFTRNLISMQREQEKLLQWLKRGQRFNHLLMEDTKGMINVELNLRK